MQYKLLHVDDEPASIALIEQIVASRTDLAVLRAGSAKLGFKLLRRARPTVILLNIDLSGSDALAFMKFVRADPSMQKTPILALGANAAPHAMTKALEAGFFHYLIKPMKRGPFIEALEYALEFVVIDRAEEDHRSFVCSHRIKKEHQ